MRFYSYVVPRDYGFAPNPFNGICTLATCKPKIRKKAAIGDWIFGTGSVIGGYKNRLIYAMKVTKKISFNDYWSDPRFHTKKPIMRSCSLKKMYGDNIYCHDGRKWYQADSHHSLKGGEVNEYNLKRDTSVDAVLISEEFYYFGKSAIEIPTQLIQKVVKKGPSHRCPEEVWGNRLIVFISRKYRLGCHDDPIQFLQFARYDGKS